MDLPEASSFKKAHQPARQTGTTTAEAEEALAEKEIVIKDSDISTSEVCRRGRVFRGNDEAY
jgi:hypothetical protein